MDVVLHHAQGEEEWGESELSFYSDDRLLEGSGAREVQQDLDQVIELFAKFCLKANQAKTKFMVI